MVAKLDHVYAAALQLAEGERMQLVEQLIDSLPTSQSLEEEHRSEARHRLEDVRTGRVAPIPAETVFQRVSEGLAQRRSK